jgi:hypothetical protein
MFPTASKKGVEQDALGRRSSSRAAVPGDSNAIVGAGFPPASTAVGVASAPAQSVASTSTEAFELCAKVVLEREAAAVEAERLLEMSARIDVVNLLQSSAVRNVWGSREALPTSERKSWKHAIGQCVDFLEAKQYLTMMDAWSSVSKELDEVSLLRTNLQAARSEQLRLIRRKVLGL